MLTKYFTCAFYGITKRPCLYQALAHGHLFKVLKLFPKLFKIFHRLHGLLPKLHKLLRLFGTLGCLGFFLGS
jgi:hypothetical protein